MIHATTSNALSGEIVSATATGSAPPMYVPIVGTNCDTMPVNAASGSA